MMGSPEAAPEGESVVERLDRASKALHDYDLYDKELRQAIQDLLDVVSHYQGRERALLAVAEAAQEHLEIGCDYGHPEDFEAYMERFDKNYDVLKAALAALVAAPEGE